MLFRGQTHQKEKKDNRFHWNSNSDGNGLQKRQSSLLYNTTHIIFIYLFWTDNKK